MADRYQGRPPTDDDFDRGDQRAPARKGSDPLAELARLIGQTDPFGNMGRANQPMPAPPVEDDYEPEPVLEVEETPAVARPSWLQRVTRREQAPQEFPSSVHPLKGYAATYAATEPDYHQEARYTEDEQSADPSRYDDARYGHLDPGAPHAQHGPAYSDDPYAYEDDGEETHDHGLKKRRGGMVTVAVVLALAVVGTGGAFAYRTFLGSPRTGEPPIIKADTAPTKVVPAPADSPAKMPDRLAPGEGAEKIVPREEQPVDVNGAPRVVLPPLVPNPAPPALTGVVPAAKPAAANALPGEEPRKIKTFTVRGDQADIAATPAAKPAPRAPGRPAPAANANASSGNAPLSLSPQVAEPAAGTRRVAANNPVQAAPGSGTGGGGYVVQVASQRNEADAQASYRALQGKYPSVLGSRTPVIKRADLGEKGVFYRAMIGPFGSPDEAAQLCGNLKTAGGQCVVQKN